MDKMTKAAELYLNHYYILNEARKELEQFLDQVAEQVYEKIIEELDNLKEADYEWTPWISRTSPGTIELSLRTKTPHFNYMLTNKSAIYVCYHDIRKTTRLTNPKSGEIQVSCARQPAVIKQELNKKSVELFGSQATTFYDLMIEPDNLNETVDGIVNQMLDCCQRINQIVETFRNV